MQARLWIWGMGSGQQGPAARPSPGPKDSHSDPQMKTLTSWWLHQGQETQACRAHSARGKGKGPL